MGHGFKGALYPINPRYETFDEDRCWPGLAALPEVPDLVYIATAQAFDDEMRARIARHQQDRAERAPGLLTMEEPLHLAQAITDHSHAQRLLVIDCMTLWLTNWMMPALGQPQEPPVASLLEALQSAPGPIVLVGNEIGLGVVPLGLQVRGFVDALGQLNQALAATCHRVTLMVAGLPQTLKDAP